MGGWVRACVGGGVGGCVGGWVRGCVGAWVLGFESAAGSRATSRRSQVREATAHGPKPPCRQAFSLRVQLKPAGHAVRRCANSSEYSRVGEAAFFWANKKYLIGISFCMIEYQPISEAFFRFQKLPSLRLGEGLCVRGGARGGEARGEARW